MKNLINIILLLLTTIPLKAEISKYTADYHEANYKTSLDTKVTLYVSFVKPAEVISPIDGIQFFRVHTTDPSRDVQWGGSIVVVIPSSESNKFIKKYGTDPDRDGKDRELETERMTGIFKSFENKHFYLDYEGASSEIIEKNKELIKKNITVLGKCGNPYRSRVYRN